MVRHAERVERARRGRLRQSVALVHGHVRAAEEREQFGVQRGAAGDDPLGAAAEHVAQRLVDDRVEGGAAGLGQHTDLALGTQLLHVVLRGDHRGGERHALRPVAGLLGRRVVHLLQHARHDDHHGRPGDLKVGDQRLDTLGDVDPDVARHADVVDRAGERVRLRQEQQHGVLLVVQQVRHVDGQVQRGRAVVLVRHLHALGCRRGTRRVHDGAQVGLLDRVDALVELLVTHRGPVRLDLLQAAGLDAQDGLQRRAFLDRALCLVAHVGGPDDQQPRVRIVDDVADLLGGVGVVDGGEHAAAGHDRSVRDIPRVGGTAHERHAVALLQPVVQQALGDAADVGERLVRCAGDPLAGVVLVGVQRLVAHAFGAVRIDVVDGHALVKWRVALGLRGEQARRAVDQRRGRVSWPPFGGVREADLAVRGKSVVLRVIRAVGGIVADRVREVTSQTKCLLRDIRSLLSY